MHNILQVMMSPSDSTAFVGSLISKQLKCFDFTNCYLHGEGDVDTVSFRFNKRTTSGAFRYLVYVIMYFKILQKKPQLIIAHRFKCVDVSSVLAKLFKCPLIIVVHGVGEYDRAYRRRTLNKIVKQGATVVCVSKYVEKYIRSKVDNSLSECTNQILTIENAIDFEKVAGEQLSKIEALDEIGFSSKSKILIGYVGRLANVKGVLDFVHAACMSEHKNYHFIVIGDGPLREELENIVTKHNGNVSISFLGFVPAAFKVFRAFDFMVLPSRSEGFPVALLEAVASKTPFVLTNIDIYKEIVGEEGVFYSPGNINELCEKISFFEDLYLSGELKKYGENQALKITNKYPYQNFVRCYERLLMEKLS